MATTNTFLLPSVAPVVLLRFQDFQGYLQVPLRDWLLHPVKNW